MNKRVWVILATILLLVMVTFPACQSATTATVASPKAPATAPASAIQPKQIVLKCVSHPALVGPTANSIRYFSDKVKEKSNGELTINILGASEVISNADLEPAVKSGTVDVAYISGSYYPGVVPEGGAISLSQLTPAEERQNGFWDLIAQANEKAGLFPLGRASIFPNCYYLYTKFSLTNPRQLSGHKFRGSGPYLPFQKALGIVSVNLAPEDTYNALQQGLIDGITWKEEAIISYKVYEAGIKYVIDYAYDNDDLIFLMSVDGFNRLPKNLQNVLLDSQKDTEVWNADMWQKTIADFRQSILKAGVSVIKFSPEDAKWYTDLAYSSGWATVLAACPTTGPKLQELSMKK